MTYEFRLPDIGEGLHEAEILNWFVKEGDVITADETVVEVQTDKAAVEIASPVAGQVLQLGGGVGDTVKVGELLVEVETGVTLTTGAASADTAAFAATTSVKTAHPPQASNTLSGLGRASIGPAPRDNSVEPMSAQTTRVLAAPAVRKLARDLGVDLRQVDPSDERGHVSKIDVEQYAARMTVQGAIPAGAVPTLQPGQPGQPGPRLAEKVAVGATELEERHPIRGVRKRIYENMMKSMSRAPQATGMDELDVSRLVEVRERMLPFAATNSIKLTYLPFIIKAVTHVLHENPIFNASVDDEKMEIIYKKYIHIGVATATPDGLLVPVIRHANHKSVFQIAKELQDLSVRAKERKLRLEELSGSTFTVSSTGAGGGWFATPILNYPEVAILGVHRIAKKAVVLDDDSIVARNIMGFSLTFDHRVIDGEPVGAFIRRFKEILENPELLMVL